MTSISIAHNREQIPPQTIAIPSAIVHSGKIAVESYLKRMGWAGYSFICVAEAV